MTRRIPGQLQPEEQKAVDRLIHLLGDKMKRETSEGLMRRDAHPKLIGLVKAEFKVEADLPADLRLGIFEKVLTFPAWVRFSNQSAPPSPDIVRDIRGLAIKIMQVDKLLPSNRSASRTHDFILISTNFFVTKNIIEFAGLIGALIAGKLQVLLFFLLHPKVLLNLVLSSKRFGSLLNAQFWSVSPYQFGDRIVKYSVRPTTPHAVSIPSNPTPDYLSQVMMNQLSQQSYSFDFMIQFQIDPTKMPTEDLSIPWREEESPFVKVATLTIPIQTFNTPEQQAYADRLSFSPWHCMTPHTPIGGINLGRKIIYDTLSRLRHSTNGFVQDEPADFTITST
jgi:hypothetical protein